MITVTGVTKVFGAKAALDGVTLSFDEPGIVAVLGPNGAGKTTLFDLISGTQQPTAGEVKLFGRKPDRTARARLGVVMQDEFVMEGMRVRDYARLFASIYGVADGVARIISEARLPESAPVARLSGGEATRLFISAATVHRPDVLLLDEPTAHLDPPSKRALGDWLKALSGERLVLMATHDLHEAERIADRAVLLVDGKVRADGTPSVGREYFA